jgi:hypothetical protein
MAATQEPTTQEPTTQEATPKWECCVCYEDGTTTAQMTLRCSHPICLGCFSALRTTTNFYGGAPPPPCCPLCRQAIRTQAGLTQEEQVEQRRRYVDLAERRRQAATVQRLLQEQEASYQAYIGTNADRLAYNTTLQELQRTGEAALRQAPAPPVALPVAVGSGYRVPAQPVAAAAPPPVDLLTFPAAAGPPPPVQWWTGLTDSQVERHVRQQGDGFRVPAHLERLCRRCPGCHSDRPRCDMKHRRIGLVEQTAGVWGERVTRLMRCISCANTQNALFSEMRRRHHTAP